jgi:hypothetical protein
MAKKKNKVRGREPERLGNEPYTSERGERESVLPLGFQPTSDPAFATTGQPEAVSESGLSAHDADVAWGPDDPLRRSPGIEADRLGAGFDPTRLGDETGDDSSPRPDENVADEIGAEAGVRYQDNEELRTVDKVAERDRVRWELNPASSEDFDERSRHGPERDLEGDASPPSP